MNKYKKILFVINPNAGIHKKENILADIIPIFDEYNYETTVCFTKQSGDGTTIVKEHCRDEYDLIVCMGGDGTLNEVFSGAMAINWKKPIGYIPAGSTNDFATSLGLPSEPVEAARHIMMKEPRYLDLGLFNGRYFVYTASAGIFTRTSYETPQRVKNVLGHFAYILEGMKDITQLHPIHMSIDSDRGLEEKDYIFVAICNTFSLGGVMNLDEANVDLDDGIFELLTIELPKDIPQFNSIIKDLYDQNFEDSSLVNLTRIERADIVFEEAEDWSLDGERGSGSRNIHFQVAEKAVQLIY